jgi:hypothetical protein
VSGALRKDGTRDGSTFFEVRNSRVFYGVLLILFGVLTALSAAQWGWGWLGAIIFGGYGLWSLARLLDERPRVFLTEEGVVDQAYLHSPGLIRWSEILTLAPGGWGTITIELRDETTYWERLSPYGKFVAGKLQLFGYGPAVIQSWGLAASRSDLLDALEDGLDEYVLRSALAVSERDHLNAPTPGE